MDISIIIVSYNTCALLRNCLVSVYDKVHGREFEVIVVDNASDDDSCAMVENEFPRVRLLRNGENRGFAAANNQAIRVSTGACVLLLNSDTMLENDAVSILYEFMRAHPRAAVCGPLLWNADQTVQRSIDTHHTVTSLICRLMIGEGQKASWRLLRDTYHPAVFDYSTPSQITNGWLTGAVLLIRRDALGDVGLLDESYYFMMEDADWGLAVSRRGWETWFVPDAVVTHLLGGSRKFLSEEKEVVLKTRIIRQHRYYVLKNLGLWRYGAYRLVVMVCFWVNLMRRVVVLPVRVTSDRSLALFKLRLGWLMLLAAMESDGGEPKGQ